MDYQLGKALEEISAKIDFIIKKSGFIKETKESAEEPEELDDE